MQHNLASIFCILPSVVPWLRPEKHLLDLFLSDEYLGYNQRGLGGSKLIPRFSWYIPTYNVGDPLFVPDGLNPGGFCGGTRCGVVVVY